MANMMRQVVTAAALLLGATIAASARHSFTAEFDATKNQTITGTVVEFQWMNPHSYIYLDVRDASGKMVRWGIQSQNPSILARQGWNRRTITPGERLTIEFSHHKDDSKNVGFARFIQKADGTRYDVTATPGGLGRIVPPKPAAP